MSTPSNVVTKIKQLVYNAGANSTVVGQAVDQICDKEIVLHVPAVDVNAAYTVATGDKLEVVEAFFSCSEVAIDNSAGNTVIFTVTCNALPCVSHDTDDSDNVAVGEVQAFTVVSANAVADAGETIRVTVVKQEDADAVGDLVIRCKRAA